MKNETFTTLGSGSECPGFRRGPQVRRVPPVVQLAEARAHRELRIDLPEIPGRPLSAPGRAVLAALRAAEYAAWQASGGDAWRRTESRP